MSNEPQTIYDVEKLKAALKPDGRWFMNHYDVSKLIGQNPRSHLPDEGFTVVYNGVTIKCDPKKPFNGRKSSKHRVHYFCACCKFVPLGRASQHLPACEATDATI